MAQHTAGTTAAAGQNTTVAVLAHIIALLFGILGAAVIYLIASDEFAKRNAANALNWQLFLLVATFGLIFLAIIASFIAEILALLVVIPIFFLVLADPIFCIIAAVKASGGNAWSYPLAPDLL